MIILAVIYQGFLSCQESAGVWWAFAFIETQLGAPGWWV